MASRTDNNTIRRSDVTTANKMSRIIIDGRFLYPSEIRDTRNESTLWNVPLDASSDVLPPTIMYGMTGR